MVLVVGSATNVVILILRSFIIVDYFRISTREHTDVYLVQFLHYFFARVIPYDSIEDEFLLFLGRGRVLVFLRWRERFFLQLFCVAEKATFTFRLLTYIA